VPRVGPFEEEVPRQVGGGVVDHADLFQDDPPFPLHLLLGEEGVDEHVAEDLEGFGEVGLLHAEVEAHDLPAGEGVQHTAHAVEGLVDLHVGAGRGSLEDQVLHEVAGAVGGRALLA